MLRAQPSQDNAIMRLSMTSKSLNLLLARYVAAFAHMSSKRGSKDPRDSASYTIFDVVIEKR